MVHVLCIRVREPGYARERETASHSFLPSQPCSLARQWNTRLCLLPKHWPTGRDENNRTNWPWHWWLPWAGAEAASGNSSLRKSLCWAGTEALAYNPSTLGGQRGQEFETSLGNMERPHFYKKIFLISWAWWCVPVVSATGEAKVGGLLEPMSSRSQWAMIMPLYSSLGDRTSYCLKINK